MWVAPSLLHVLCAGLGWCEEAGVEATVRSLGTPATSPSSTADRADGIEGYHHRCKPHAVRFRSPRCRSELDRAGSGPLAARRGGGLRAAPEAQCVHPAAQSAYARVSCQTGEVATGMARDVSACTLCGQPGNNVALSVQPEVRKATRRHGTR
jgi:hypothetical protein